MGRDERSNIFSGYVTDLYKVRKSFPKSDVRNFISKLLMNSLYGRFGMSPILSKYDVLFKSSIPEDVTELEYWSDKKDISFIGDYSIVESEIEKNSHSSYKSITENKGYVNLLEISTPLAMFTTAYARIFMAEFKIKYHQFLFYCDTDSLVLSCPLPNDLVGEEIGKFKLEYIIEEGIFLGPKVYSIKTKSTQGTASRFIVKIKGYKLEQFEEEKENLKYLEKMHNSLYTLLNQGNKTLELKHSKFFRSLSGESISKLLSSYKLQSNENKRNLIYEDRRIVDTTPLVYRT